MQTMAIAILIDHDPGIRKFLETFLGSAGFLVLSFATAERARAAMIQLADEVSVLICDVDSRDMDALRLARQFPRVPILLTSAWGELPEAVREFPALLKPFRPSALISILRRLTQPKYASASAA
jgi:DNA-binding NtrC family response regulator